MNHNDRAKVLIVEDDEGLAEAIRENLESIGYSCRVLPSSINVLDTELDEYDCLLLDVRLPRMSGTKIQEEILGSGAEVPIVFMTGYADVPMAVKAMKLGAIEFLQKPFREIELIDAVNKAVNSSLEMRNNKSKSVAISKRYKSLTPTEKTVMELVCQGLQTKQIAYELKRSPNTIKIHRQRLMEKMEAASVTELVEYQKVLSV